MFLMPYMRKILLGSLLISILHSSIGQQSDRIPSEKPELIIGLIMDQMRSDQLYRYWDKFGDDGFKKLMNSGTVMNQAGFHYYNTQSGPGYATIATGTQPSVHGIVSNDWYGILKDDLTHCTGDISATAVGGHFELGQYSPGNLMVSTFSDEMKLSGNSQTKVYSIGWSNESAILSGGHAADAAFWIDPLNGKWMTSSHYKDSLPAWVQQFNEKKFPDIYLERIWSPLLPLEEYTEYFVYNSDADNPIIRKSYLPIDLEKSSRIDRRTRDYSMLQETPFGNTLILDMAMTLLHEKQLGKDQYTDYLAINLPAMGPVSERYGQESIELEDVFLRLDQDLAHFLSSLDDLIGKNKVLIFLTATHGMNNDPKYLKYRKLPAGEFDGKQALSLLRSYLNVKLGRGEWIKGYYENQIYLNRVLIEDSKISLDEVRKEIANFMIQFEAVAHATSATTISSSYFPGGPNALIQKGYSPKRSGDVMVVLRSGWGLKGQSRMGTGYNYDRKVPLIWYGWKVGKNVIYRDIDIADIAPTISFFLNIPMPDACTGKPILDMLEY